MLSDYTMNLFDMPRTPISTHGSTMTPPSKTTRDHIAIDPFVLDGSPSSISTSPVNKPMEMHTEYKEMTPPSAQQKQTDKSTESVGTSLIAEANELFTSSPVPVINAPGLTSNFVEAMSQMASQLTYIQAMQHACHKRDLASFREITTSAIRNVDRRLTEHEEKFGDMLENTEERMTKQVKTLAKSADESAIQIKEMKDQLLEFQANSCPFASLLKNPNNLPARQMLSIMLRLGPDTNGGTGMTPFFYFTHFANRPVSPDSSIVVFSRAGIRMAVLLFSKHFSPTLNSKFTSQLDGIIGQVFECPKIGPKQMKQLQSRFPTDPYTYARTALFVCKTSRLAALLKAERDNVANGDGLFHVENPYIKSTIPVKGGSLKIEGGSGLATTRAIANKLRKFSCCGIHGVVSMLLKYEPDATKDDIWEKFQLMLRWNSECNDYFLSHPDFQDGVKIVRKALGYPDYSDPVHIGANFHIDTQAPTRSLEILLSTQFQIPNDKVKLLFEESFDKHCAKY
jgi:hypothetical protein